MPANAGRTYSATRVLLELNGELAASLTDAEGGELFADVVPEPPSGGRIKKHLGPVRCTPITIGFGAGMGKPLFEWLVAALAGKQEAHDGALIFLDYKSTATGRLNFSAARITDILLPTYAATSKQPTRWEVVLQPEAAKLSHDSLGSFHPSPAGKGSKSWLATNFAFSISGLENACAKVSEVESIRVRFPPELDATPDVGNVAITISSTALQPFQTWHEDFVVAGHNGDEFERTGSILQRSPDLKQTLCSVALKNVGIVRITPDRVEGTTDVVARSRIELYLEEVELTAAVLASFAEQPKPADEAGPTAGSTGERLLRGAELAARLRSTDARFRVVDDRPPRQREGDAAGDEWARRAASLAELESIAALPGDWTELRLPVGHSLARELAASGVLVADPGAVELTRDEYVDALVGAATRVYREALPHLEGGEAAGVNAQAAEERLASTTAAASNLAKRHDDAVDAVIDHIR
jgi:hypothetical protein